MYIGGSKFYPIQVAEKLRCSLRLEVRGPAGHGSNPIRDGAMARLGRLLLDLERRDTPVHISPVTRLMVQELSRNTSFPEKLVFSLLLVPGLNAPLLKIFRSRLKGLDLLFRNTISPTIVHGGDQINVIPCQICVDVDGRMLPGFQPEQMAAEVQMITGQ